YKKFIFGVRKTGVKNIETNNNAEKFIKKNLRKLAVEKIVRIIQVVQAIIVAIPIFLFGPENLILYAAPVLVILISEITTRMSK
ncbi:MAG: hypothetical protein R3250_15525, partial [Melioribacteraceae bacterium]|nr:hypothetical protein [Melioribacteraceae bacterium]